SLSGAGALDCTGRLSPRRYAAQAAASAASASFAGPSTSAIQESPSGLSSTTAGPRLTMDQPAGARKLVPRAVLPGVTCVTRAGVFEQAPDASAAVATNTAARSMRHHIRARAREARPQ